MSVAEEFRVLKQDNALVLSFGSTGTDYTFYYLWLRDHCKCSLCYNSTTLQRKLDCTDIPTDVHPKAFNVQGEQLTITWQDGHVSTYSINWLQSQTLEGYLKRCTRNPKLWTASSIGSLPVAHVTYGDLMTSTNGVRSLVSSLVDFGVGFVEEVPANVKSTEEVVRKLSHVQHTLFGGMWEFSDVLDHSDTAYTTEALGAHTDNTYFTEAAGLQILHCIHHDGSGGENLLVDGFMAATLLKEEHPEVFHRLTTTQVEAEYRDLDVHQNHHTHLAANITLHPLTKQVQQIRYNQNDRSPLASVEPGKVLQYYEDLKTFATYLKSPALEWWFKLSPGTVLFFDNFRTLHGRSSYTGHRVMCGCYVGRADFLSKARVFGLL